MSELRKISQARPMRPRHFKVTLAITLRQVMEVISADEDAANDIALATYHTVGAQVIDEEVEEIEEITAYRERV